MRNTLIQYKGGGYDGCFFEWNFGFFGPLQQFDDIFSSGRKGCKYLEEIKKYIADSENEEGSDYFLIDMTDENAIKEFVEESNAGQVIGVSKWFVEFFNDEYFERLREKILPIMMKCVDCKQEHEAYELEPCDHEAAGGIEIQATAGVCHYCAEERYTKEKEME